MLRKGVGVPSKTEMTRAKAARIHLPRPKSTSSLAQIQPKARNGRHAAFALRLERACDDNQHLPAHHHGRQAWIRYELAARLGVSVSSETVSKWFTGVARPRPERLVALARLLEVDEAWLMFGREPAREPHGDWPRTGTQSDAALVLAGLIGLCGGHAAFPDADDPLSTSGAPLDLYAIIQGAHYTLHVVTGAPINPGTYRLAVSDGYEERLVIGMIPTGALTHDFIELETALVARHGLRRGRVLELNISVRGDDYFTGSDTWRRIRTFAEPL